SHEETGQGGHRIGHPKQPQHHREEGTMSDERSSSVGFLRVLQRQEDTPNRSHSEQQADNPEFVLIGCDTYVIRKSKMAIVYSPHCGVVLDQQNRYRHQKKTYPWQEAVERVSLQELGGGIDREGQLRQSGRIQPLGYHSRRGE